MAGRPGGRGGPTLGGQGLLRIERAPDRPRARDAMYSLARAPDAVPVAAGLREAAEGMSLVAARVDETEFAPDVGPEGLWRLPPREGTSWRGRPVAISGLDGCVWWAADLDGAPPRLGAFRVR